MRAPASPPPGLPVLGWGAIPIAQYITVINTLGLYSSYTSIVAGAIHLAVGPTVSLGLVTQHTKKTKSGNNNM